MSVEEFTANLQNELEPPYDVMIDPSLLTPERSLEQVETSEIFEARDQSRLGQGADPIVRDIYVPSSFVELLEGESQFDLRRNEAWTFFTRQATGAFGEDILELLDRRDIRTYSSTESDVDTAIIEELDWDRALGTDDRYEFLRNIVIEEAVFMMSSSILKLRRPYSIDAMRDAGIPTADLGDAQTSVGGAGGPPSSDPIDLEPGKFTAFIISNALPATDPIWGPIAAGGLDYLLYKIDP